MKITPSPALLLAAALCVSLNSCGVKPPPASQGNGPVKDYTAMVIFTVDKRGQVISAHVEKPMKPVFDQAAIRAIKRGVYPPGEKTQTARKPVTFHLKD
ncbi:MAG: Gram-negative bacterial TonB protein C-terminal [Akkermansiaceae bacterium]|nr:Gram-negative bacterial TonB protein C-terminal [Akkermansiaceae bacterium]